MRTLTLSESPLVSAVPHAHPHTTTGAAGHAHPALDPAPRERQQRRLAAVLVLTLGVALLELVGGLLSGSLALLADAGHMVTDGSALTLSWVALWLMGREPSSQRTYGFRRAELLAAFVNAMALVGLAVWIVVEALHRIQSPPVIREGIMFWVALVGLAVNVAGMLALREFARASLNIRSALWHVAGDLFGSLATLAAAGVIRYTGWTLADPLLGLAIAALIGVGGGKILLDSANLLLDSVPRQVDGQGIRETLAAIPEVRQICDLHIWGVSSAETMLTAHLVVDAAADRDALLRHILKTLESRFHLAHMTVQLESAPQESCRPEW
jgi:cobalt-zinc-cadmium efflux system protein